MEASSVSELLFNQLNFRGERQKVISTNIANIDTPGYKTKELMFNDQLDKSQAQYELKLKKTHSNHMEIQSSKSEKMYSVSEIKGLDEQNDGNNVNLDTQMSTMAQNSIMFQAIQSSIKKDSTWFKTVIDASGKN